MATIEIDRLGIADALGKMTVSLAVAACEIIIDEDSADSPIIQVALILQR